MSGQGFFEECWTPIHQTNDQGEPMQAPAYTQNESLHILDPSQLLERLVDEISDRHPLSRAFWEKLLSAGEMHDAKQADYGRSDDPFYNIKQSANWGVEPWVGAMMRLDDKVGRLRNLVQSDGELRNEPIEDSLLDIAVYALIALVLREEQAETIRPAHVTALS